MNTDQEVTARLRFTLDVGLLVRGQVRRALEQARFNLENAGGELEIREVKSLLASDFHVRGRGPAKMMLHLQRWAEEVVNDG
jgi:hypothetical protein